MTVFSSVLWKAGLGVALLAVCIGLWMRGEHYAARARTSEVLLKSAIAIGNANAALARAQADQARKIDAVASLNALRKRALRTESDTRRKAIINAPVETDGPLAPVLRDQLDRLPEPSRADPRHGIAAAANPVVVIVAQ